MTTKFSNIVTSESCQDEKCKDEIKNKFNVIKKNINSKKRKIKMTINLQEFIEIVHKKCYYCGELNVTHNGIDRVNSLISYNTTNVVPCCSFCNMLKGGLSIISFFKRILHMLSFKKFITAHYNYDEAFHRNLNVKNVKNYENCAKYRNIPFEINSNEFELVIKNNCYLCGFSPKAFNSNGIDRINNDEGYTINNISACCSECNYMKKNYSLENIYNQFLKIYNNLNLSSKEMQNLINQKLITFDKDYLYFQKEWLLDCNNKHIHFHNKRKRNNCENYW